MSSLKEIPMTDLVETQLFIDGVARPASNGETYEIFNPARPSELVGRAASGTPDDVEAAVKAAHCAFPAWAALSYGERAEMLHKVAAAITQAMEEVDARVFSPVSTAKSYAKRISRSAALASGSRNAQIMQSDWKKMKSSAPRRMIRS